MAKKPSLGRQKIKIAKIESKNHLQVTFSKRRVGLFKKASELCTLCGVEVAIIVFSPAGKVFSFGHPNVEAIVDQFLTRNPPPNSITHNLIEAHRNLNLRELNQQLTQVLNELEVERKRGESMEQKRNGSQLQWWETPINKLGLNELNQLRASMEELKENLVGQTNKILVETTSHSSPFFFLNNIGMGSQLERKPNLINASSSIVPIHPNFGYAHGVY